MFKPFRELLILQEICYVGATDGRGGVPNGVGVKMIGVGVRGMGLSKFKLPDWNNRKTKRKARMKVKHNDIAHCDDMLLWKMPNAADQTSETSALYSRKSSRNTRGFTFAISARSDHFATGAQPHSPWANTTLCEKRKTVILSCNRFDLDPVSR